MLQNWKHKLDHKSWVQYRPSTKENYGNHYVSIDNKACLSCYTLKCFPSSHTDLFANSLSVFYICINRIIAIVGWYHWKQFAMKPSICVYQYIYYHQSNHRSYTFPCHQRFTKTRQSPFLAQPGTPNHHQTCNWVYNVSESMQVLFSKCKSSSCCMLSRVVYNLFTGH